MARRALEVKGIKQVWSRTTLPLAPNSKIPLFTLEKNPSVYDTQKNFCVHSKKTLPSTIKKNLIIMVGWSVGRSVGGWVVWLVGWWVGWLVGWLVG